MPRRKVSKPKDRKFTRTRYVSRRKVCIFCTNKSEIIDYKDAGKLRNFVSTRGKIEPRRRSGTCAKHQRALATAIKRARHLALLPYVPEHVRGMQTDGYVPEHARGMQTDGAEG